MRFERGNDRAQTNAAKEKGPDGVQRVLDGAPGSLRTSAPGYACDQSSGFRVLGFQLLMKGCVEGMQGLTLRKKKGRTVFRGCLTVRQASLRISSTRTCLGRLSPSDRAVATLLPGWTTWKLVSALPDSCAQSCYVQTGQDASLPGDQLVGILWRSDLFLVAT